MMQLKNEIIKNFTLGFIPILAFIVADQFFGPRIGLIVALIIGTLELLYQYVRYKRIEKFVLFDIFLIFLLGGVSILLNDDIFFKLKPAFIELILVLLFGVHAFSSKPILLIMGKRYLKDMEINPLQAELVRKMSVALFWILLVHTALIIYSAYYWSREMWGFISGGLFYIIIAMLFVGQFLYTRFIKAKHFHTSPDPADEWLDLVNQSGKIIGKATRKSVHGNPDLMHPTVHVHVFNRRGKLFLQKRSKSKDLYPGLWDTAIGGHVDSGETIDSALLRESKEELGIEARSAKPLYRYVMRNTWESELIHTYMIKHDGPFRINKEEIEVGRFWSGFELQKMSGNGIFTPNLEEELKFLKKLNLI